MPNGHKSWPQVGEHASTLLAIRDTLFDQLERDGYFSDSLVADRRLPSKENARLLAPLAFGVEGALIPLGLFSYTAALLKERGYLKLSDLMIEDPALKRFAVDKLKNTPEAMRFARLFESAFGLLSSFDFARGREFAAPYADQDVLDIDCWILAALVDLDDLFFMGSPFIPSVRIEQKKQHDKALQVLSQALGRMQRVAKFTNYPDELNRRGWFGNLEIMEALDNLPYDGPARTALQEKLPDFPGIPTPDDWKRVFQTILTHRNIVETTLVTTRAVLMFSVVAEATYRELGGDSASDAKALAPLLQFFDTTTNEIFRNDTFAEFVLTEFSRIAAFPVIPAEDYDIFIHAIGILSFAVTRGFFSEVGDVDQFREVPRRLVRDRSDLVGRLLNAIEGGFEGALVKENSFVESPNWFVATKDWSLLFGPDGKPAIRYTPDDKKSLGEGDRFQFILALPLVVKALANISYEERQRVLRTVKPEDWKAYAWPTWLSRVDILAEKLARAMVTKHVKTDGASRIGFSRDAAVDLSVTAGVVDALSLWCAALMLRAVADGELESESIVVPPSFDPFIGLTADDIAAVGGFFQLLKRWTGPPTQGFEGNGRETAEEPAATTPIHAAEADFFHVLWQVMQACYGVLDGGFDWEKGTAQTARSCSFQEFVQVVGLVRHLQRQTEDQSIRDKVLIKATDKFRGQGKGAPAGFDKVFGELRAELREEFGGLYQLAQRDGKQSVRSS